ncbi:hypothetical protein D2N39_13050 [Gemmobacter lutimaris]|uniref:Uncharacterized protein n=1 Tax=Gemmobacter lutimaris TaxID=2306023 RepID=A0A398BT70_9RHOB|nr:hypothetical protein [Gemmobacter lutimaris]RID91618.1 hypothetical protein D2N39_13050 [Gemmobacter lutimaris]
MTIEQIKAEAARRVARMTDMTAQERRSARSRIEAELHAEAAAAAEAATKAQASASALGERKRIASVVAVGTSMGRSQAAIQLALAGPITEAEARAVLTTLPMDTAGPAAALPAVASFGTTAERAERARIVSILNCEEATDRRETALAFALQTAVTADVAIGALLAVPKTNRYSGPSIEERQRAAGDFGHQPAAPGKLGSAAPSIEDTWAKAVASVSPRSPAAVASGGPAGPVAAGDVSAQSSVRSSELAAQAARWADEERGIGGK